MELFTILVHPRPTLSLQEDQKVTLYRVYEIASFSQRYDIVIKKCTRLELQKQHIHVIQGRKKQLVWVSIEDHTGKEIWR